MAKKSKAFFYEGSWYHRTKILKDDFTVSYSKKGGFKTQKEAEESYEAMEAEFQAKRKVLSVSNNQNITLMDYLNYWFYQVEIPQISSATRMVWEIVLTNLLTPHITDIRLNLCTTEYFNTLLEKVAPYSMSAGNKSREFLFLAMKAAVNDGYLKNNPIVGTKTYPRGKPKITILTKAETKKLIAEMKNTNWYLETMLALFCGLRKGEILGLKFSDFDVKNRTVTIQRQVTGSYLFDNDTGKRIGAEPKEKEPKTENSYRTLRVPNIIMEQLEVRRQEVEKNKAKLKELYEDNDYVCGQKNGKPSSLCAMNIALNRACKNCGVRKTTVHSLRHMYATVLMEQGVPLVKISALLGHSSIHTTFEYYCDVIDERDSIKTFFNDKFSVDEMEA